MTAATTREGMLSVWSAMGEGERDSLRVDFQVDNQF